MSGEPLRDEQTQDDGERGLGRPGAVERVEGLGVQLLGGFGAARVADGRLALLARRRLLLDAETVCPGGCLAVVVEDERAEQLDRVRVELWLPAGEAAPRSRLRARAATRSSYALALAAGLLLRRRRLASARVARACPRSCSAAAWAATSVRAGRRATPGR